MAKKGGYQFQADLSTDEEFDEFLMQPGLLLLEIYSEWCGPCLGMIILLKSIQVEVGVENLHLAICKSDTISYLKRFRRTSEPRWLFVLNGRAVDILFGTNVPIILQTIRREVTTASLLNKARLSSSKVGRSSSKKKNRVSEITFERITYDIAEPQPEEVKRQNKKDAVAQALIWQKVLAKEKVRRDYFMNVTNAIIENLPYMGVTVFGPQVQLSILKRLTEVADSMHISCKDRKMITATKEDFDAVNYLCKNPLSDEVIDYFVGKQILLMYWRVPDERLGQVQRFLHTFARECTIAHTEPPADAKDKKRTIPPLLEPLQIKIEVKEGDKFSDSEDENEENKENKEDEPHALKPTKSTKSIMNVKSSRILKSSASGISPLHEANEEEDVPNRSSNLSSKSNRSNRSLGSYAEDEEEDEEQYFRETSFVDSSINLTTLLSQMELSPNLQELLGEINPPVVEEKKIHHKTITIPPIWVANTHRTHAALIYKYFRNETKSFLPPDPIPIPPHVIMSFPAYKMKSLMLEAERFKEDVMAYGFFNTDETSDSPKLIANSVEKYMTKHRTDNDVLVFKIAKKTSNTMLSFAGYGPSYVSPTVEIGEKEAPIFFPGYYVTAEEEAKQKAEAVAAAAAELAKAEAEKRATTRKKKLQPDRSSGTIQNQKVHGRSLSSTLSSRRSSMSVAESAPKTSTSEVEEYNATTVKFSDIVREHELPVLSEKTEEEEGVILATEHALTPENKNNDLSSNLEALPTYLAKPVDDREKKPQTGLKKHRSNGEIEYVSTRAEGGADVTKAVEETGVEKVQRSDAGDAEIMQILTKSEIYTKYVIPAKVIRRTELSKQLPVIVEEEYEGQELNEDFKEFRRNDGIGLDVEQVEDVTIDCCITTDDEDTAIDAANEIPCTSTPPNSMILTSTDDNSDAISLETSDEEDRISETRIAAINAILFRKALEPEADSVFNNSVDYSETKTFTELKALFESQIYEIHGSSSDTIQKDANQTDVESPEQHVIMATNSTQAQLLQPTTVAVTTECHEWFEDTRSVVSSTFVDDETLYADVDNLVEETGMVETAVLIANLATAVAECLALAENASSIDDLIAKEMSTSSGTVVDPMLSEDAALYETCPRAPVKDTIVTVNNSPPTATKYIDLFEDFDTLGELPAIPAVDKIDVETRVAIDSLNQTNSLDFSDYTELCENLGPATQSIPAARTTATKISPSTQDISIDMPGLMPNVQPPAGPDISVATKDDFPTERTAFQVGVALTEILGLLKVLTAAKSQEISASPVEDLFAEETTNATLKEPTILKNSNSTDIFDIAKIPEQLDASENLTLLEHASEDLTLLEHATALEPVESHTKDFNLSATPVPVDPAESIASVESATIAESIAFAASFVESFDEISTANKLRRRHINRSLQASAEAQLIVRKSQALTESLISSKVANHVLNRNGLITVITSTRKNYGKCPIPTERSTTLVRPAVAKCLVAPEDVASCSLRLAASRKTTTAVKATVVSKGNSQKPQKVTKSKSKKKVLKKLKKVSSNHHLKKKSPIKKYAVVKKASTVNFLDAIQANFVVSKTLPAKSQISKNLTGFGNLDQLIGMALAETAATFKDFAETAKCKTKKNIRKTHKNKCKHS